MQSPYVMLIYKFVRTCTVFTSENKIFRKISVFYFLPKCYVIGQKKCENSYIVCQVTQNRKQIHDEKLSLI